MLGVAIAHSWAIAESNCMSATRSLSVVPAKFRVEFTSAVNWASVTPLGSDVWNLDRMSIPLFLRVAKTEPWNVMAT